MPRDLVLGNGRLLVAVDGALNLRDLYYPQIGMLNHICGHKNRIGIWEDGRFSWLEGPMWARRVGYDAGALVGCSSAESEEWGLIVQVDDAVCMHDDLYIKRITARNLLQRRRSLRIFFTHDFSIDQTEIGDTALYDLATDALIHYKRDKCFLMAARTELGGLFQYATGIKRFAGMDGVWKDAEDGRLEGNPIAQGSVDSAFSVKLELPPKGSATADYWIAAGERFQDVWRLHARVEQVGAATLLRQTRSYWRAWWHRRPVAMAELSPAVREAYRRSLLIIRTQIDRGGAILAANDSDILQFGRDHYSYMWPRDAAFISLALDRAGYPELTRPFFELCARLLAPGGFLWHKYNPDGSVGSSWHPWILDGKAQLPIQEDETALVLVALHEHYEATRDLEFIAGLYEPMIRPAADFMAGYRDEATGLPLESYDLWEERRGVFTFTACAVWRALKAAACFAGLLGREAHEERYSQAADGLAESIRNHLYAPHLGRYVRGVYFEPEGRGRAAKDGMAAGLYRIDETLESSLCALFLFDFLPLDDPGLQATMEAVASGLWVQTDVGGIARYERDQYFYQAADFTRIPGNPWIICTMWLAEWHILQARRTDDLKPAEELLEWAVRHALPSGVLPEQVHPLTGAPVSVAPLTWSHSSFVHAVLRYVHRRRDLERRAELAEIWQRRAP